MLSLRVLRLPLLCLRSHRHFSFSRVSDHFQSDLNGGGNGFGSGSRKSQVASSSLPLEKVILPTTHIRKLIGTIHPDTLERYRGGDDDATIAHVQKVNASGLAVLNEAIDLHKKSVKRLCVDSANAKVSHQMKWHSVADLCNDRNALRDKCAEFYVENRRKQQTDESETNGKRKDSICFERIHKVFDPFSHSDSDSISGVSVLSVVRNIRCTVLSLLSTAAAVTNAFDIGNLAPHFKADLQQMDSGKRNGVLGDGVLADGNSDEQSAVDNAAEMQRRLLRQVNGVTDDSGQTLDAAMETLPVVDETQIESEAIECVITAIKNKLIRFHPELSEMHRRCAADTLSSVLKRQSLLAATGLGAHRNALATMGCLTLEYSQWRHVPIVFTTDPLKCALAPRYSLCLPWFVSEDEFVGYFNANISNAMRELDSAMRQRTAN